MISGMLFMLLFRTILLLIILVSFLAGDFGYVTVNAIVWIGSLFVPWMGTKDERYYALDAFSMAIFSGMYFALRSPTLLATLSLPFGIDKLFHVLGGMCVAWFMLLTFEKRNYNIYAAIFLGTIAIGVAWEIFEYVLGLLPPPFFHEFSSLADSGMDLIADLLGASIVAGRQAFKAR